MKKYAFLILSIATLAGCQQGPTRGPDAETTPPNVRTGMHTFSETLSGLLPKLYSDSGLTSAADRKAVADAVKKLSGVAHDVSGRTVMPSKNPNLKIISAKFSAELASIDGLIQKGQWSKVQNRLTSVTRYCIACHTSGPGQSSEYALNLSTDLSQLSHYQKARYLAAVRRFDDSVAAFETALNDKKWAAANPKEWDIGLVSILSIVTHVRKDANLALEILSAFRDRKVFPARLEPASAIWRQQAKAWDQEKKKVASLVDVEEWVRQGSSVKSPAYANTFMYIRASARLNELLTDGALKGEDEVKALYLNGVAGAALGDFNYFSFPEQNFELCAKRSPTSKFGKMCAAEIVKYRSQTGVTL